MLSIPERIHSYNYNIEVLYARCVFSPKRGHPWRVGRPGDLYIHLAADTDTDDIVNRNTNRF